MTKASDNAFPSVLVVEGSAPSSPSAGNQRVYIDSSDHHLKRKNSSGTVTDLESGSASLVSAHAAKGIRASTNLSLGNNTYTVLALDGTDEFDTDSIHDPVTNNSRFVVPSISGVTTGLWEIVLVGYTNATSGRNDIQIRKNAAGSNAGGTLVGFNSYVASSTGVSGMGTTVQVVLSATDYLEVFVRTSGGTFSAIFDAGASFMVSLTFLGKVT